MIKMVRLAHLLNVNDLKMKVAKICQQRHTSFNDGIPKRNWLSCLSINTSIWLWGFYEVMTARPK